jgi:hypothetical protein
MHVLIYKKLKSKGKIEIERELREALNLFSDRVNSLEIERIELGPVLNNAARITADTEEAIEDQTSRTRPDIENTWRGGALDVPVMSKEKIDYN